MQEICLPGSEGGVYFPRKNGHVILGFLYCVIEGIG